MVGAHHKSEGLDMDAVIFVICSFAAGPNSFLVRPSDNSPGNFTLFFLCKQTVQRFKIEQQGNQLVMGGRHFEE